VRYQGLTRRVFKRAHKALRLGVVAVVVAQTALLLGLRDFVAEQLAVLCLTYARHWLGHTIVNNPAFVRTPQTLADFTNAELYSYRITARAHIGRLLAALQFPAFLVADNRSRIAREEALLLWLSFIAFPRRMTDLQQRHGLEYSQISRFLKCVWEHVFTNWGAL
jgi:hypothetical protein